MATPVWKIQRELEYAQKRQTYLARTDRPAKPTSDRRSKSVYAYRSLNVKIATAQALVKIQVPDASVTKFTLAALGLYDNQSNEFLSAVPPLRGFKPAQVHALFGTATPAVKTALTSGRRYIKYSANATGEAQSSYSAAISKAAASITIADQENAAKTIAGTLETQVTKYGRVWFTPEKFTAAFV